MHFDLTSSSPQEQQHSVELALNAGARTPDIGGALSTGEMGDAILSARMTAWLQGHGARLHWTRLA